LKTSYLSILGALLTIQSAFAVDFAHRGYLSAKGMKYVNDETNESIGQRYRAQFEQTIRFNENTELINQVRANYNSLYGDISKTAPADKKDKRELYLGDNYLKIKSDSWVLQTGYQDVAWGEAFGFNYADIINPKDLKETFYSDYSESRLPLFMVNFKYFFENGSLQLIYSPEPRFSKALPVDLFTRGILPQTNIIAHREETPDFFKQHEYGGKLSTSFWGLDASLFYFSYLDRDPVYTLKSATPSSVVLQEIHERNKSLGISLASTLYDNFVLRSDVVHTKDKRVNSVNGLSLVNTPVDVTNVLLSLDTPSYEKISAVFILAGSFLSKDIPMAFREKEETYSIAKLSYDLGEEKVFDLSYTHEFSHTAHAIQALYTWPVSSTLEIRIGAENYWGNEKSQLAKIKNVSNVFFGIKNYFQL